MPADAELSLSARQGDDVLLTEEAEPTGRYRMTSSGLCCVSYGRTRVLCSLSENYGYFPATCHVGPHWGCMLVTYCLAMGPALFFFAHDLLLGLKVALLVSICLTTASFTMVACSDPGVVFHDLQVSNQLQGDIETGIICAQCEVRRPLKASHCSDCGVCVRELDHHCPWTGKCVGERTIKWFYVFLTFISLHCMLIAAVCLVTFVAR
uniref:Palmitoyltransferase n=1 Tax=Phytophthora ramorum TaxID=164328 RepID=H3H6V6_PHYRM